MIKLGVRIMRKIALSVSLISILPVIGFAILWTFLLSILGMMWVGNALGIV